MVYKFFDKKSALLDKSKGSGVINEPNYRLANELHKPIIRKFMKRKVDSYFQDNIWGVDLADMQSLSKYNKEINIYYAQLICLVNIVPIKDKKGISIVNAFKKIISEKR